ncbi:hypothetical protein ACFLRI_03165 [Bacteroidota bacterium]
MKVKDNIKRLSAEDRQRNKKFLWIGLAIIISIQVFFAVLGNKIPEIQSRKVTSGFVHDYAKRFFYFYYYKGLFPVATTSGNLIYSKDGADQLVENEGESLIMEYKHWSRMGENARIFAFLPDAFLRRTAQNPSIKLFNSILFLLALMMTFSAFYRENRVLLGALIVLIFSFTPFFMYEVHHNKNVFGLLASVFLIILSLNLDLMFNEKKKYIHYIIAIATGLIIGLFTEIRGEIQVILLSAMLMYFFASKIKASQKAILILTVFLSFYGMKYSIRYYFDTKFEHAAAFVEENGGHVYTGPRMTAHSFWHPVFCGLGDFDQKYGYKWDDIVAYNYAIPILKEKYKLSLNYSGKYGLDEYYDKDSLYYKKLEEFTEYDEIVKTKVLGDIKSDPGWYIEILFKRIERILKRTLPFDFAGWLILPVFILLLIGRERKLINLLLVSLPLSLTPLIIFSKGNATYNSVFPILSLSIMLMWIFRLIKSKLIDSKT